MTPVQFLFLDTETGGLDPDRHSILSIGLAVVSRTDVVDTLEIDVREPRLFAEKSALAINRIDLAEHVKTALTPSAAVDRIIDFIGKWPELLSENNKVVLFGHNILFDIQFLKRLFCFTGHDYASFFSHRNVDTSSILRYLHIKGAFKEDISALGAALDHFGINEDPRHRALQDSVLTAKLFQKLLEMDASC